MNAPSEFNPHLKWLGIRAAAPDHYQLLGIERFESDGDVIAAAADRQMAHVRKYQNGPHSDDSQRLLNELAAAKLCLLSPEGKIAYDEGLAQLPEVTDATTNYRKLVAISVVVLLGIAVVLFVRPRQWWRSGTSGELAETTTEADPQLAPGGASDGPSKMIPVGISPQQNPQQLESTFQRGDTDQENSETKPQQPRPPLVTVIDAEGPRPTTSSTVNRDQAPWEVKRPDRRLPQRPFPGQNDAKARLLQAFYDRKQSEADKYFEQVLAEADSHLARLEADRLEQLYWKSTQFWEKVALGVERTSVGATLQYRGQPVTVTAKAAGTISLRAAGGQTKQFDLKTASMNPDLAIALARANGRAQGLMLDVMIAVFLATDRDGDLIQAKPLLDQAHSAGIAVEVLLAKNEGPADSKPSVLKSSSTPAAAPEDTVPTITDSQNEAPRDNASSQRLAPPIESVRQEKRQLIRDVYREQYALRDEAGELALAKQLFNDANRTKDDPDSRFTMYEESIRLASKHGDVQTTNSAIRAMAYNFDVKENEVRLSIFKQMRRNVRSASDRSLFCSTLAKQVDEFLAADDFEQALDTVTLASLAARSFRKTDLLVQFNSEKSRIQRLRERFSSLASQRELLAAQPEDDEVVSRAHLDVGSFLAFEKGDYERGAHHLLLGSNEALSELAQRELDAPQSPVDQLALADLWWEISESNSNYEAALHRAVHWYQLALPELEGISKKRALARTEAATSNYR